MSAIINYPEWWDKTVTVYNRFEDTSTHAILWYRHVIDGCFWQDVSNKLQMGETVLEANQLICRIRENPRYMSKYAWINSEDRENYFTLGLQDILILGDIDEEIDEYQKGKRASDIIAKYKQITGVLEIESISDDTGPGRCNPHYKVRGI